jgi:hypothetical protein
VVQLSSVDENGDFFRLIIILPSTAKTKSQTKKKEPKPKKTVPVSSSEKNDLRATHGGDVNVQAAQPSESESSGRPGG